MLRLARGSLHSQLLRPQWIEGTLATTTRAASSAAGASGIIEIREYTAKPEGFADFMKLTAEYAPVRKELLPFLGMFTCEVGGVLHKVTHFYHYKDFDERDRVRGAALKDERWRKFVGASRAHVAHQTNKVLLEAGPVYQAVGSKGAAAYQSPPRGAQPKPTYELRTYQLHPGYGSVPKLMAAFEKGLPDKVAADAEGGQLVLLGYTDVGMLNNVVELWRYNSAQACIRARQAAREVPSWRDTISSVTPAVQSFTSEFLHPTSFSPWQ